MGALGGGMWLAAAAPTQCSPKKVCRPRWRCSQSYPTLFYSSMVIRDLTLRSAASFGSFHLIRLLYDEYMYYLIEHRVAQAKGETPIAVMGEVWGRKRCWRRVKGQISLHQALTRCPTFLFQFASLGRGLSQLDPDKGKFNVFIPQFRLRDFFFFHHYLFICKRTFPLVANTVYKLNHSKMTRYVENPT